MSCFDYETIFATLPEGVFTIDPQFRITSFNRMAADITGFNTREVVGQKCWDVFRSDRCRKNCPLGHAMETGETRMDQEINTFNRRGERQILLVNVGVMRNDEGRVLGAIETFRSIRKGPITPTHEGAWDHRITGLVGRSPSMRMIFSRLTDVASSEANVLISGESGTGKELLARAVHRLSAHRKGPFVAVNCAALAESLLESELFGHEKGAFTGAERTKPGRFEMAKDGTLFLDEIGEMKPELQVKLLRIIEQREFERVGGTQPIRLDARIISATNQDLNLARSEGRFREDLYYRLRTVPLHLPPLRERPEDIPLLMDHFIHQFNQKYNKRVRSVDPKVVQRLTAYSWPGNVRELERCIEHAFVFVKGPVIFAHYLPDMEDQIHLPPPSHLLPASSRTDKTAITKATMIWALNKCNGRRQEAAALLGISRTSMWRRMKEAALI
ncbi:MAG: sigma 54-interacting transcriptional regulator [Desulfobacteraceae bacterium]|nr:sigma 54-interacting transcriptional regulator [Desulfobacteraceae bacterium]